MNAPSIYCEHPGPSSPVLGSWFLQEVLDALTANPEVWSKTVLIVNFDENDGLFDHVPPPAPPAKASGRMIGATTIPADDEYHLHAEAADDAAYLDHPYGLGMRVPLYVISP
ncbi:hypothetical protein LTR94_034867, partial [Friedmanniomyces endolithicus]